MIIDHKKLIAEIEIVLRNHKHESEEYGDGIKFTLTTSRPAGKLVIEISSKWVGYDFMLKEKINNNWIGYGEDTDLYALDFDPKVTMQIFDEVKSFLVDLLNGHVFIGNNNGQPITARLFDDDMYDVKSYRISKWLKFVTIDYKQYKKNEIPATFALKPVKL